MQTHYTNSKGQQVEIATMLRPHLANARDKLAREADPARSGEIEAMTARLAVLDADYAEEINEANGDNPRIRIGANNPPEEKGDAKGWPALVANMDDLLVEARNWADGAKVESDAQEAEVDRLIDDLRDAASAADDARVAEKEPLDKQIKAIQDRYNPYIAPLQNKKPGSVMLAISALQATVHPWKEAKRKAAEAEAQKARDAADAAAAAAAEALRSTDAADLGGREAAEALVEAAAEQAQVAKRAEKAATTGTGLTRYYEAVLTDQREAVLHYMKQQPREFLDLCQRLAAADVRAGKHQIPGFEVREQTRVS